MLCLLSVYLIITLCLKCSEVYWGAEVKVTLLSKTLKVGDHLEELGVEGE